VLSQGSVEFDGVGYDIQHIAADSHICFYECDKFFAVMRMDPDTILEAEKTEPLENAANFCPIAFTMLLDIKDNHSPSSVPAKRFTYR